MTSTNFTPGTVVTSTWLNEVDEHVFNTFPDSITVGADPTGTNTSTTALQSLFTNNSGKSVWIKPGTYKTGALSVPDNTTVFAYGATLDFSTFGNITGLSLGANTTIVGVKLIGPGTTYNASSIGMRCAGTNNSPSAPTYKVGPKILYCTITSFAYVGIELYYVNRAEIAHCYITTCAYMGINVLSSNRVQIHDNYVGQISPGTGGNAYGIAVSSNEGTTTEDPAPYLNYITGNIVEDVTVWTGIDTHGGDSLVVNNNIVRNCKQGIKITDRDVNGVRTVAPKNVTICGNFIDGASTSAAAITVNGAYVSPSVVDYAENITVTGNVIKGHGTAGDVTEGAIRAYGTKNLNISGNTSRYAKVCGIVLDFDNIGVVVNSNTITDAYDSSVNSNGIYINGVDNSGSIANNVLVLENAAYATKVMEYAVFKGAGATSHNLRVDANVTVNNSATKLLFSSFAKSYSGGDTTPSVANTIYMTISNGGATTITNFDDGVEGQMITLKFNDANTTIDRTNCYLSGGVNFTSSDADTLTLRKIGSAWYEVARGVNA